MRKTLLAALPFIGALLVLNASAQQMTCNPQQMQQAQQLVGQRLTGAFGVSPFMVAIQGCHLELVGETRSPTAGPVSLSICQQVDRECRSRISMVEPHKPAFAMEPEGRHH